MKIIARRKKRNYVEVENITNQLMYLGPASSLLRVEFDIKGQPHIIGVDGVAYWEGIPKNEEKRILRNVRKYKSQYQNYQKRENKNYQFR